MRASNILILPLLCSLTLSGRSDAATLCATLKHQLAAAASTSWDSVDIALCVTCIISLLLSTYLGSLLCKKEEKAPEDDNCLTRNEYSFLTFNSEDYVSPTVSFEEKGKWSTIRKEEPKVEPGTILLNGVLSNGKPAKYIIRLADVTEREQYYIGRTEELVDLHIQDSTISGIHAVLSIRNEEEGMAICITDRNSTNGTNVNNRIVTGTKAHKLSDKDHIRLGKSLFTIHFPSY